MGTGGESPEVRCLSYQDISGVHTTSMTLHFCFFRERGREEEREGEKYSHERETLIRYLLYVPQPGTKPATLACALTRN